MDFTEHSVKVLSSNYFSILTLALLDFKQVFAECSVPAEVIARNTKAQEIVTVKLTSR